MIRSTILPLILFTCVSFGTGCTTLVSSVTQSFAEDLSAAILNSDDLEMVRDGAPSYLILIDSLVARTPDDAFMLQQSAKLHSAYAAAFVQDTERAKLLNAKAKRQSFASVCLTLKDACDLDQRSFAEFSEWVGAQRVKHVSHLFELGVAWAGWMQTNSDDFNAIADLGRVKLIMQRVAELEPSYDNGGVFLYLGVFETLLPPALGGKPELGRQHFERAVAESNNTNLLAKVMFAQNYARLVFDRELHDQLLTEVIVAPPIAPGLTLMNTVAKEQAQQLLDTADDYF